MTDTIEIPDDWQQLHWQKQVKLAEAISGKDLREAAEARGIIQTELKRRAKADKPAVDPKAADDAPKVPLRLLRDTWQGEKRIYADGRVTEWSLAEAKNLIAAGVAERADPLPGE